MQDSRLEICRKGGLVRGPSRAHRLTMSIVGCGCLEPDQQAARPQLYQQPWPPQSISRPQYVVLTRNVIWYGHLIKSDSFSGRFIVRPAGLPCCHVEEEGLAMAHPACSLHRICSLHRNAYHGGAGTTPSCLDRQSCWSHTGSQSHRTPTRSQDGRFMKIACVSGSAS